MYDTLWCDTLTLVLIPHIGNKMEQNQEKKFHSDLIIENLRVIIKIIQLFLWFRQCNNNTVVQLFYSVNNCFIYRCHLNPKNASTTCASIWYKKIVTHIWKHTESFINEISSEYNWCNCVISLWKSILKIWPHIPVIH